jgi:CRP-like cAMP-binding protein
MVADSNTEVAAEVETILKETFPEGTVYVAHEGSEALKKIRNVPPKLLITGMELGTKVTCGDLCRTLSMDRAFQELPILVISDVPDSEPVFVGELSKGLMKFISLPISREELVQTVKGVLDADNLKANTFNTVALKPGDFLFKQGEKSTGAYLLKTGKLQASHELNGNAVVLGHVMPGEFVGEMAHITGDPRSANVMAVEPSELIEIPCGTLDLLIFAKPTWTKALMKTLCRRVREANLKRQ